tara:strand:- start:427 stop:537 length:111 start_codon:yes stop_codon:yes gene_type:complete
MVSSVGEFDLIVGHSGIRDGFGVFGLDVFDGLESGE